jgi:hypothetical protein
MAIVLKTMVAWDGVELYCGIDSVEVIDSNNSYNALNSMIPRLTVHGNIFNSFVKNTPRPGILSEMAIWTKPLARRTLPRACPSANGRGKELR